jgi:hypothetical protein
VLRGSSISIVKSPTSRYLGERWGARVLLAFSAITIVAITAVANPKEHAEPTVDELKAKISIANVGDKPRLCIEVAQLQLKEADKLYATGEIDKAQASLADVVSFSEQARDYSIQSHKHQKQSEIAVRAMTRKLNDILHTLSREDQVAVKDALNRLERVRDDLLASMFKKGS